jgi:hypothetical protein
MKIIFLLLLILLTTITFPQEKKSSAVHEYLKTIDSLINIAREKVESPDYKPSEEYLNKVIDKIDLTELKHIAGLMYKATDMDDIAIKDTDYVQAERVSKSLNGISRELQSGRVRTRLWSAFNNKISPVVYALTRVAYFLRVNIDNIKIGTPFEDLPQMKAPILTATIQQVYKGTGKYKAGDHIEFYYFADWEVPHPFEVGKDYFVPLEPRGLPPLIDKSILTLVPYLNNSHGYYPILNGYLIENHNYFGYGKKVPYDIFEQKLRDKIKEVESW